MSHLPEREEKICLNCNTQLHGRYCHICSQENVEPREGFWHLVTHFFFDLFHFDGKFIKSLKYLLFSPGFLSKEHLQGKRANYLHPIRMYVFTSAFFFLLFFIFFQDKEDKLVKVNTIPRSKEATIKLKQRKDKAISNLNKATLLKDSVKIDSLQQLIKAIDIDSIFLEKDTSNATKLRTVKIDTVPIGIFSGDSIPQFQTLKAYDSAQQSLPPQKRDGFFMSKLNRQNLILIEKYNGNQDMIFKAVVAKFVHLFPQILITSLPLFGLLLLLLYVRSKKFYYVDHMVFSIHVFCATLIIILIGGAIIVPFQALKLEKVDDYLAPIFALAVFFHWYKSLRNFYGQSRAKTIFKFLLLSFLSFALIMPLVMVFFMFISAFTIH